MDLKKAFGQALRRVRIDRGITQEGFTPVSGRTYISTLERGVYSPSLDKIDELAQILDIHPLSLITLCYLERDADLTIESATETLIIELKRFSKNTLDE